MAGWLLDTNILLRRVDRKSADHSLASRSVANLLARSEDCYLTAQVVIEFWVVATRPVQVNGLGWSVEQARAEVDLLLDQFPLLEEQPAVFGNWLSLVAAQPISGKRAYDARIVAVMQAHGLTNLLTLNTDDFIFASGIKVVHPRDVTRGA